MEQSSPTLDIGRYISMFRRRIRLFGAVVLGVFLLAVLATLAIAPRYSGVAQVMLDPRKHTVLNIDAVVSDLPTDTDTVDTEVEVVRSRALAERIVKAENLDQDAEFNASLKPGMFSSKKPIDPAKAHERTVDRLMKSVKVARTGLTYVISIEVKSKDAAKAARLANAFADQYVLAGLDDKLNANQTANQWLNGRLETLRQEVQTTDAAVQAYKASHGLMSAEGNTLTEQDISNLTNELAQARAAQAEQDAKLSTARQQMSRGSNGEDVGEALSSPVIQQLRAQRAEVSRKVAELEAHYGPRHPDLIKAQRQLSDYDSQIHAEITRIVSGLEAQDKAARSRTASVEASLNQARGRLASNDAASVQLNELQRNADSARTLYQSVLDRYKQTSAQAGIQQSDARVLTRAQKPSQPSVPNVPLFVLAGLVFGLGLGAVVVVISDLLEQGITSAGEAEQKLGVPCIGTLPLLSSTVTGSQRKAQPPRYIVDKPFSAFAESFRNLRTAISHGLEGQDSRVIAITSALPNEGKTTSSICLARAIAQSGASVVVVDCDLRRRTLQNLIGKEPKIGLLEVIAGSARIEDALVRDAPSGAYLLPLTDASRTTSDVFGSEGMEKVLADLRQRFSYVILDTAPILPVADTRVLAPKADGVVVIARWRKTNHNAVSAALRELDMSGAHVLGVALAQADMREIARAGAGYPDHYFHAYKGYYVQ